MGFFSVALGSPSKAFSTFFLFRPLAEHFSAPRLYFSRIIFYNIGLIGVTLGRELIGACQNERMKE